MKTTVKPVTIIITMLLGIVIGTAVMAAPLDQMQNALVFLQKSRMSSAAPVKTRNLERAKELLSTMDYNGGGHRAAALALVMQAIGSVNELNMNRANRQIDTAIVKVKHAIQAIKQEQAAKNRQKKK